MESIRAPLPDITRHVIDPSGIRFEGVHRGRAVVPVCAGIPGRKIALPDVAQNLKVGWFLLSPGKVSGWVSGARRCFPFRLSWQAPPDPVCKRPGVMPRDVDYRVVKTPLNG